MSSMAGNRARDGKCDRKTEASRGCGKTPRWQDLVGLEGREVADGELAICDQQEADPQADLKGTEDDREAAGDQCRPVQVLEHTVPERVVRARCGPPCVGAAYVPLVTSMLNPLRGEAAHRSHAPDSLCGSAGCLA